MRLRGPVIACMLVGLGVSSEPAVANGVIVVPVNTTTLVLRTRYVQQAPANAPAYKGWLHRLCKPGTAPVFGTTSYYEAVTVSTKIVVSNPIRPCYKKPPTASPQSLPAPSPQSTHDHASPSAQTAAAGGPSGCGECWPRCFMVPKVLRCTCCIHITRHVAANSPEAIDIINRVNNGQIGHLQGWNPFVAGAIAEAFEASDPADPTPKPCSMQP